MDHLPATDVALIAVSAQVIVFSAWTFLSLHSRALPALPPFLKVDSTLRSLDLTALLGNILFVECVSKYVRCAKQPFPSFRIKPFASLLPKVVNYACSFRYRSVGKTVPRIILHSAERRLETSSCGAH